MTQASTSQVESRLQVFLAMHRGVGELTKNRPREKRGQGQYTSLSRHKKKGTELRPPLSRSEVALIDWSRDLLPEHLWIGSLAVHFGLDQVWDPFTHLMDALDDYLPEGYTALGLISDFAAVPESARRAFLLDNSDLVREAFLEPLGRQLAFYPLAPARWLVSDQALEAGGALDPERELPRVRKIVEGLLPGKDPFSGRVRTLPMYRLFKHQKVKFFESLPVASLIPRYPGKLNAEDRYHVESVARQLVSFRLQQSNSPLTTSWAEYFWRHNLDLAICRPREAEVVAKAPISAVDRDRIATTLHDNAVTARDYLLELQRVYRPDLYDPTRDEVLSGLFSRVTRLYCVLAEDPYLWARDLAGILLRALADSAISFGYLAKKGTAEDFARFVRYGEGQQKLLMLQLQDLYPGGRTMDGRSMEDISAELGGFLPELMEIELGHWAKADTRKLAIAAGMEPLYRLVFTPASGDLHGSWISLKESNLTRCSESLHRYHRLPSYVEPPFYLDTANTARELYEQCRRIGVESLGYPRPTAQLARFDVERPAD